MERDGPAHEPHRRAADRRRDARPRPRSRRRWPAIDSRLVLTSPKARARDTAAAAGFPDAVVDDDLREWDYGELEGLTTAEIRGRGGAFDGWSIWRGPVPGGETIAEVAARAGRVLERVAAHGRRRAVLRPRARLPGPRRGGAGARPARRRSVRARSRDDQHRRLRARGARAARLERPARLTGTRGPDELFTKWCLKPSRSTPNLKP